MVVETGERVDGRAAAEIRPNQKEAEPALHPFRFRCFCGQVFRFDNIIFIFKLGFVYKINSAFDSRKSTHSHAADCDEQQSAQKIQF